MQQYVCEELNIENYKFNSDVRTLIVYVEYILIYYFSSITQTIKFDDVVNI